MWKWDQSAGELSRDGKFISSGYAGKNKGVNNPALQGVAGIGPLPAGRWSMVEMRNSDHTGPMTIVLHAQDATPNDDRHDATGRGAFRIHGDNVKGDRSASKGCIILPRPIRLKMWNSGDHDLLVVA
jgi:hypothetical protein